MPNWLRIREIVDALSAWGGGASRGRGARMPVGFCLSEIFRQLARTPVPVNDHMSVRTSAAVWEHSQQRSPGALLVLLALADCTNHELGRAWPSIRALAAKCRMSERNVQRYLRRLEEDREINIVPSAGPHGTNYYVVALPLVGGKAGCRRQDAAELVTAGVTTAAMPGDNHVTQSVIDPSGEPKEPTPIVPIGDEELFSFWVKTCFDCFGQSPRPLRTRQAKALLQCVQRLDRTAASSLLQFYRHRELGDKEPTYSSRPHSPERLILRLEQQLACARRLHPAPQQLPTEFTLVEVCAGLREIYPGCYVPRTLREFYTDHSTFGGVREEVLTRLRAKKKAEESRQDT